MKRMPCSSVASGVGVSVDFVHVCNSIGEGHEACL